LNVRDVEGRMPASFRILTSSDDAEAKQLAQKLFQKDIEKRERVRTIIEEVERKISGKDDDPVIFEGDPGWELILLGLVASLLSKRYKKPIFLYKIQENESQGGIRTGLETNLVDAMNTCSKYLVTYGGHPRAAGFRVKNENLELFKKCLFDYYGKKIV